MFYVYALRIYHASSLSDIDFKIVLSQMSSYIPECQWKPHHKNIYDVWPCLSGNSSLAITLPKRRQTVVKM